MPVHMAELLEQAFKKIKKPIKGAKIALLGVAFLENSDDIRNTPVKPLYDLLKKKGALPILHDPFVKTFDLPVINNLTEVIRDSDALVLVTKHREYLDLNLDEIKKIMRTPIIIDGRNAFNKNTCEEKGFIYLGVGKPM
jgi:UDP-N-acetyl-D-mannosaminuronic acid dehydrogenase